MNNYSIPFIDGWISHKNKIDVDLNPYNHETQKWSWDEWNNGWCMRYSYNKQDYFPDGEKLDEEYY